MKARTLKLLKVQGLVFLGLFVLAELILRLAGLRAGTLIDDFAAVDKPVYMERFISDETGINHMKDLGKLLMKGSVVNAQGFRGNYNYTPQILDSIRKYTRRKIIMVIGDSFVEGCCADSVTNSFPDLLARGKEYEVLNFGVAGTDPLQYALIAEKYAASLKPDLVLVCVYFGNDILTYERKPTPGIPLTYPFIQNKWIYAVAPNHLSKKVNYVFQTPQEAYDFYLEHYTLKGPNRNFFERLLSYSVIFSKIYLVLEHRKANSDWQKSCPPMNIDNHIFSYTNFKRTKNACDAAGIPCLFVGIPAPAEATTGAGLKETYKGYFKEIGFEVPVNLTLRDYDGADAGNHFNNEGHVKYALFLKQQLDGYFSAVEKK